MARLSIGVPVWNGARFLDEAISSLLAQTFSDFELIISDNASVDETEAICRYHAARDSRVRYERQPENRGAAWNYNRVLELATGEYFKWAAHDDFCDPRFLERCVAFLDREPQVVLVYARVKVVGESGEFLWEQWHDLDIHETAPHRRLRRLCRSLGGMLDPVFGVIRTSALRQTRGHGSFLSADYVILAELAMLGEFREVPEFLFSRRLHSRTSRSPGTSAEEAAQWFRPGRQRRIDLEYWTVFAQHLLGIRHVPLSWPERLRCVHAFVPTWLWIWRKPLTGELKGALESLFLPPIRRSVHGKASSTQSLSG